MTIAFDSIGQLSDQDLLDHVQRAASHERHATAELIALLMELDSRRLYLAQGCSSLFTYCMEVLRLSEHAAYGRIETARAVRRFPVILEWLAEGSLNLTTIGLLSAHLTPTNHLELLEAARHKSKRQVEQLLARVAAKPDAPSLVRKLPEIPGAQGQTLVDRCADSPRSQVAPAPVPIPPKRSTTVKPLAPERYKIQFTIGRETYDQLRRVQDLLRHSIPNGDPAAIFERALKLLLGELLKRKLAATDRPRTSHATEPTSRHIPAAVKREVWRRDGGQCAFRGMRGRCTETGFLEFHHVVPFADGGQTTVANLELRCRAHNAYEAEQWFGPLQSPLLREGARNLFGVNRLGLTSRQRARQMVRKGLKLRASSVRWPSLSLRHARHRAGREDLAFDSAVQSASSCERG
jgi:hypothetical protein